MFVNPRYREHDILVVTADGHEILTKFPYGPDHNVIKPTPAKTEGGTNAPDTGSNHKGPDRDVPKRKGRDI